DGIVSLQCEIIVTTVAVRRDDIGRVECIKVGFNIAHGNADDHRIAFDVEAPAIVYTKCEFILILEHALLKYRTVGQPGKCGLHAPHSLSGRKDIPIRFDGSLCVNKFQPEQIARWNFVGIRAGKSDVYLLAQVACQTSVDERVDRIKAVVGERRRFVRRSFYLNKNVNSIGIDKLTLVGLVDHQKTKVENVPVVKVNVIARDIPLEL